MNKRLKEASIVFLVTIACVVPYFVWSSLMSGKMPYYFGDFLGTHRQEFSVAHSLLWINENLFFYIDQLMNFYLFRWPSFLPVKVFRFLGILIGLFLFGFGFKNIRKSGWTLFLSVWLPVNMAVLCLWKNQSGRYLFPLLPFLLYVFFQGVSYVEKKWKGAKLGAFLTLVSMVFFIQPSIKILSTSLGFRENPLALPEPMFNWVRENSLPEDIFATNIDATFYLKTSRQAYNLPYQFDAQGFLWWVKTKNISYVVLQNEKLILKNSRERHLLAQPSDVLSIITSAPTSFQTVFEDPQFHIQIFKVL